MSDEAPIHLRYEWTAEVFVRAHKLYLREPLPRALSWFAWLLRAWTNSSGPVSPRPRPCVELRLGRVAPARIRWSREPAQRPVPRRRRSRVPLLQEERGRRDRPDRLAADAGVARHRHELHRRDHETQGRHPALALDRHSHLRRLATSISATRGARARRYASASRTVPRPHCSLSSRRRPGSPPGRPARGCARAWSPPATARTTMVRDVTPGRKCGPA